MDSREQWRLEEEHDEHVRLLNQAEELLNDYRTQANRYTGNLVDYVQSFYHDLPYGQASTYSDQFQQTYGEYDWQIKQQAYELDEQREQEQREYVRKLEE
jgi:hypothetical protein